MDWMYDANKQGVNSEEYLLGKSVDSAILDAQAEKQRQAQQGTSGTIAVDMTNKIREDPLFAIKQREAAKRKALLENPIRLKQLQHMLQSEVGDKSSKKSKKKKEKKSKKSKKHKRSHHKSSSEDSDNSEESDDDLDAKLMEKLKSQALKGREEEVKAVLKGQQYGLIGGKPSTKSRPEKRSDDKETRRSHERQVERIRRDEDDVDARRKRRDREEERGKSRSGHSSYRNSRRSRSRSPVKEERRKPSKMDEAELERRRKEMMDNAKWRDEQRQNRVEKYKHEAAKEDAMERKKSKKAEFFNPLKVTSNSSVEDRIKRNIHNIQRTKADLDKNFAKR